MDYPNLLGHFTLADEIERFDPSERPSKRRAETLIKTDELRVVLVTMLEGGELQEHTAPGPITIHVLRGTFEVSVDGGEFALQPGSLLSIDTRAPHAVRATADGAFLLTIRWP